MSFVSCILATRDYNKYLDTAVESILNQSHQDFELLIIVNGNKEAYEQILSKFVHPKIRVYYSSIRQLAHSLNVGIDLAKGEFIARMDDDDISLPERFKIQLDYLNNHPEIFVVGGNAIHIDENGMDVSKTNYNFSPKQIVSKLWLYNYLIHPSVMMRKSAILEVGGYSGIISQDYFLWMRLSQKFNGPLAVVNDVLIKYRIHPGQERGRLSAYAASASYLLYCFLMYKEMTWLAGAIIFSLKSFIKPTKQY